MNVTQVANLFDAYCDEGDLTVLSDARRERFLRLAYDEFRQIVTDLDDDTYLASANITVSSTDQVDLTALATPLLGPAVTAGNRLMRLLHVHETSDSVPQRTDREYRIVDSFGELRTSALQGIAVLWSGPGLIFSETINTTILLTYLPDLAANAASGGVDWSLFGTSDTEFIDDLSFHHDVIALLAWKQYALLDRDGDHVAMMGQLKARLDDLESYLRRRRGDSVRYSRAARGWGSWGLGG